MCTCVYIHMSEVVYSYNTCMHIYPCMLVSVCVSVSVLMYLRMYACMYVCVCSVSKAFVCVLHAYVHDYVSTLCT